MEFQLTKNQQKIFDAIEGTNQNILVLGKPGVGKSVLIRALTEDGSKTYTLAAPTGLAALNIDGRTMHSIFKLPVSKGIIHPEYDNYTTDVRTINNIRYNVRHLIIDEISMVRADMFDYLDRLLKEIKGNNHPFGGVQIIAVGDFFQLPPVVVGEDKSQLKEANYKSPFIFHSHCFPRNFKVMELNEVLRQKGDNSFIKLLDSARIGQVSEKEIALLNKNVGYPGDIRIKLCPTNSQADQVNGGELRRIPGPATTFIASKFGDWPALPVEENLQLKVGAQVLVKKNGADRPPGVRGEFESKVVNGTLGKVVSMEKSPVNGEDMVTIEMEDGQLATIYKVRWEKKVKHKNEDGKWEETVVASYEQMPLALAWAISMHKSQGQSFDKVHIDPSRVFAAGQMYVALSRCRSLAGVSFQNPVEKRHFWADMNVLRFVNDLEEEVNV